jgi:hypothetical protein
VVGVGGVVVVAAAAVVVVVVVGSLRNSRDLIIMPA